ncbi:unnamed protein product [Prunus armeniaca]
MATQAHASITTTKGSAFDMLSPKLEWIIDSGATDHTTFDPSQLISRKPSTQSVTSSQGRRLITVLDGANSTNWTGCWIVRPRLIKLSQQVELVLRGRKTKFGYGINVLGMPRSGPAQIATLTGAQCFVTFIDDCTRMTWVSLLKSEGEVSLTFQQFHKMDIVSTTSLKPRF